MAQKTLTTRIILRNDTSANWTASNPTLLKGEIGLERDTDKYKIGDGTTTWGLLPYFANLSLSDKTSLDTLIQMLANDAFGKVDDVQVNDTSVVKNKVAKIIIGEVTFSAQSQTVEEGGESFTGNIILHKISKTGKYEDLIDAPNTIDNLNSTSITDNLSANQGRILKQMVQSLPTARAFSTIQALVSELNAYSETEIPIGTNLYVQALNVPDFWVYGVESEAIEYSYTDDDTIVSAIKTNGFVQIGHYKISLLETAKVDLTNYYTKDQVDSIVLTINNTITSIANRVTSIENDEAILRSTDSFILDGGNSEV